MNYIMSRKKLALFGTGSIIFLISVFLSQISLLLPLDRRARYQEMSFPLYDPALDTMCIGVRPLILLKTPEKMYVCETEEIDLLFFVPLQALKEVAKLSFMVTPGEKDTKNEAKKQKLGASLEAPNFDVTPKGLLYKQPKAYLLSLNWTWIIKPKSAGTHLLLMDFEGFPIWLFSFYKWDRIRGNEHDEWNIVHSLRDPQPIEIPVVTEIGLSPTMHALLKYLIMLLGFILMYPLVIHVLKKVFKLPESKNTG